MAVVLDLRHQDVGAVGHAHLQVWADQLRHKVLEFYLLQLKQIVLEHLEEQLFVEALGDLLATSVR